MIEKIGLQTFTIRRDIKTVEGLTETLGFYSQNGIKQFELSRIAFSSEEILMLKNLKTKLGIAYTASQITLKKILRDFDFIMKFSNELNIKYLEVSVIPAINFLQKKKGILNLSKELNQLGRRTKEHGISLLYHHHNYELIKFDNQLSLDILINNTDADYVNFVCDTYWMARSGYNPAKFIEDRINRIKGLHLRDNNFYYETGKFHFADTVIGEGTIDFESIIKLDNKNMIDFYSIEQDTANPKTDVLKSYKYLAEIINK